MLTASNQKSCHDIEGAGAFNACHVERRAARAVAARSRNIPGMPLRDDAASGYTPQTLAFVPLSEGGAHATTQSQCL
jgi:hypothetical protein